MASAIGQTPAVPRAGRLAGLKDAARIIDDPVGVLAERTQRLGPTFGYSFGGVRDVLVTSDPAVMRHVLKTNHRNYHKSWFQTSVLAEFTGIGIFNDTWDVWRPKRQQMAKAFHPRSLDALGPTIDAALDDALAGFEARAAEGPVSLRHEVVLMTFGTVARSFFGMSFPLTEIAALSALLRSLEDKKKKEIFMPFLRPWWQVTGQIARHQAERARLYAILRAQVEARRAAPPGGRPDLLDLLLEMADPAGADPDRLSPAQILVEAGQFLVAGHDTSSTAFTWILLLLDRAPQTRASLAAEFEAVLGGRAPRYSDIASLPQANAVVEEALRLYPPFWMIDRMALADDTAGGVPIPAGTTVILFLYGMHHAPALWEAPEAFRADRFDASLWQTRAFCHLPFGGGPRRCIASNFAKLQILCLLHRFLRRYDVELIGGNDPGIDPGILLSPKGPVRARIRKRPRNAPCPTPH